MKMRVGIVVLNYNDAGTTLQLIKKINNYAIQCIVVVDNNSTDNSYQDLSMVKELYNFTLFKSEYNGGYSYGNNLGLRYIVEEVGVDVAIIANPDVVFEESILENVTRYFDSNTKCGLVSPKMIGPNGKKLKMWLKLPTYLNSIFDCFFIGRQINKFIRRTVVDQTKVSQIVDILPGSFLAFRADTLRKMGYLDENVFLYYEENIIGERLKSLGEETVLLNDCSYIHNHSVTIKKNLSILNAFRCNLRSKLYYEKAYHHISGAKELFLKAMMKYAVFEMSMILRLRSFFKV